MTLIPKSMRSLWEWWKRVGVRIGEIQARVLLTLFYVVVLAPFALLLRLGSDPLAIKPHTPRGWRPSGNGAGATLEQATKQF